MTREFAKAMIRRALAWLDRQYSNGATNLQLTVWSYDASLAVETIAVWPWTVTDAEFNEIQWRVADSWHHRMTEYNKR